MTSFAGADSHDEYCFSAPSQVIRGPVIDPTLNLDNWQIARRHTSAFLIQRYLADRITQDWREGRADSDSAYGVQLFEVLGTVESFLDPTSR